MKAYRLKDFTGVSGLVETDEPVPRPQRGEVLVAVRAVSINFRDIAMLRDSYPVPHQKGLIPISDAAGEVVGIGVGVHRFGIGDRVMGVFHPGWYGGRMPADVNRHAYGAASDGWLTEYKVVSQEDLVAVPDHLSFEEASTLPCAALTAWTALTSGEPVRSGQTVLVQGTGGVSLFALQLSKALGARVIATTSSSAKAGLLRDLGADQVINYLENEHWGTTAKELAGGIGVDRVIEVGGPGTMSESLRSVRPGGEIAAIGFLKSDNSLIDFYELFGSGANFRHISVGSREALADLTHAIAMSGLRPIVDSVFGFENSRDAFTRVDNGAHVGKVVIRVSVA